MKILSAQQIREADAATIAEENIDSYELMERAARAFTNRLLATWQCTGRTWIFCGTGNNGGDGLCIARQLSQKGYAVRVVIVGDEKAASKDFQLNFRRIKNHSNIAVIHFSAAHPVAIDDTDMIIDAIFGSGLNRAPADLYADAIQFINEQDVAIIAVDLPSGLPADEIASWPCIKADVTLTFEFPKRSFFFPEHEIYTGIWEMLFIGLSKQFIASQQTNYHYILQKDIAPLLRKRKKSGHKGTYGHSLVIAGTAGMEGAGILCSFACLAAGSGLVTWSGDAVDVEFPEVMHVNRKDIVWFLNTKKISALAIGPGLGTREDEIVLFESVLKTVDIPIVIDADAINLLAQKKELLSFLPLNSILTPHPKEFERLFGTSANEDERIQKQLALSKQHKIIILYKKANTVITMPDGNVYFNSSGNPGMATAGSGDVLTGMITALLAQQYTPAEAALAGVYLHGHAGDLALADIGGQNLVAGDLIDFIPVAVDDLDLYISSE